MARYTRRQFLQGSLALAGCGLLTGCGQPSLPWQRPVRVARIGWLALPGPELPVSVRPLDAFRQGLAALGYVEGRDHAIEYRSAEGREERLPDLAAELVRLPVDVLVAGGGTQGAWAAKQATDAIPVVFAGVADPVEEGLVASLARPGGNVTGLATAGAEIHGQRLQRLKEAVPGLSRVDFLWNPTTPIVQAQWWTALQVAADKLGVAARSREARDTAGLEQALAAIASDPPDGLIVHGSPAYTPHVRRITDLAAASRLPAMYFWRDYAEAGGLMSYGPNLPDIARRAATYVDKLLKGARPADLPVERPDTFEFVINRKAAEDLGLWPLPDLVLQQATELVP